MCLSPGQTIATFSATLHAIFDETYDGRHLGQRLNLKVRFDWLNTEICVTALREMLQMVDTRRNLLLTMMQK